MALTLWVFPCVLGYVSDVVLRSDRCSLVQMCTAFELAANDRGGLGLSEGWSRRWTAHWSFGEAEVICAVRDLGEVPVAGSEPMRRFSWRARQRHRPGLQFLVSTGRHHGFESLEEQRLLLALDFVGVKDVLPQPFWLRFDTANGRGSHVPDFLAIFGDGSRWLFDVRPAGLIEDDDVVRFAAAAEAALGSGWAYTVVTGWQPHVFSVLDALSAQRRRVQDLLGLQPQLLAAAARRDCLSFAELVNTTSLPAVARAHALHLLWHHRLGVDLGRPLGDGSLVWRAD